MELKQVEQFVYLDGCIRTAVTAPKRMSAEKWVSPEEFSSFIQVWTSKESIKATKMWVYEILMLRLSALLHHTETWNMDVERSRETVTESFSKWHV